MKQKSLSIALSLCLLACLAVSSTATLLTNASFDLPDNEDWTGSSWSKWGSGWAGRVTWADRDGSGRGAGAASWDPAGDVGLFQAVPATSSLAYTFSIWARRETNNAESLTELKIEWFDASSNLLHAVTNRITGLTGNSWASFSAAGTCTNPSVHHLQVVAYTHWNTPATNASAAMMWDDASLASDNGTDTDGDGMPDWWEAYYGFDPASGVSPSPVAWWTFDEGAGVSLSNAVSGLYTGIAFNIEAASWISGHSGRAGDHALWFDGSNDYVKVVQPSAIITQEPFTISAWVWEDTNTPNIIGTILSDSYYCGSYLDPGYVLGINTNQDSLTFSAGSCVSTSLGITARFCAPRRGRWVHVVAVCDENRTQKLYVDGTLYMERAGRFEARLQPDLLIGQRHHNPTIASLWKGAIDDVRIYRAAFTASEIASLAEARGDADLDGKSNLQEFLDGTNPRDQSGGEPTREGAIEVVLVPQNWATNSPYRYLAHYDDPNSGSEMHLRMTPLDQLEFVVNDAQGFRHSIRHPNAVKLGHIVNGWTNRIVAAWRRFNSGATNASLALMVNGIEWHRNIDNMGNPKFTDYLWESQITWDLPSGYYEAERVRIDFSAPIQTGTSLRSSSFITAAPAMASDIAVTVHTMAMGMVSGDYPPAALPFEPATNKTVPRFSHLQTLVQELAPYSFTASDAGWALPQERWDTLVHRYAQVADAAELNMPVSGFEAVWDNNEHNMQALINAGNTYGVDMALTAWAHLWSRIVGNTNWYRPLAHKLSIDPSGLVLLAAVTNSYDPTDPVAVSNYLDQLGQQLTVFSNYTYAFFDETTLQGGPNAADKFYGNSLTYSSNALCWFRSYLTNAYGPAYADARFPVSPVNYRSWEYAAPPATNLLRLDDSVTNRLQITTDPDLWAKWWEWRNVVFAGLMDEHGRMLHGINASNPFWKGVILFISAGPSWSSYYGLDGGLLSKVPGIDWMVMENVRLSSYGMTAENREAEVRLQMSSLREVVTNGTGFGNFAQIHTIPTNVYDGLQCSIPYMTQDVAYALAPEYHADLLVVYSASVLVEHEWNAPSGTNTFDPVVQHAWNTVRFRDAWEPVTNPAPEDGTVLSNLTMNLSWSCPEKAVAFDVEFSTDDHFGVTNASAVTATPGLPYDVRAFGLPVSTDLFWRVRGHYPVFRIASDNSIIATTLYFGAWFPPSAISFSLWDSDGDGMPQAWEVHYFGVAGCLAGGDEDGDGVNQLAEYQNRLCPTNSDTDGDLLSDSNELWVCLTDGANADTDGDGLSDGQEVQTSLTDPRDPDSDGDGMPDPWEITYSLNPNAGDAAGDPDGDLLLNGEEYAHATRPDVQDTDGDGLTDHAEVVTHHTDPTRADSDGDGLSDGAEIGTHASNPLRADTDLDGIPDGWEAQHSLSPVSGVGTSLVAWWTFDQYSGFILSNAVPGGYHGIITNAWYTNWVSGWSGCQGDYAFWFDGLNDYVDILIPRDQVVTQSAFTVAAWVRIDTPPFPLPTVFSDCGRTNTGPGYLIQAQPTQSGKMLFFLATTNSQQYVATCYAWTNSHSETWSHVAGTFDGSAAKIYVNGSLIHSVPATTAIYERNHMQIAKSGVWSESSSYWKGAIDDIRLYNRALASNEVASLFEAMADADGDGQLTWQEYVADTDPTNSASAWVVDAVSAASTTGFVVGWPSATGRTYTLLACTNVLDAFTPLADHIAATPPDNVYTDKTVGAIDLRFYRAKVHLPR